MNKLLLLLLLITILLSGCARLIEPIIPHIPETSASVLEVVPVDERASVLKWEKFWQAIETLGFWMIGAFVFLWFVPSPFRRWK